MANAQGKKPVSQKDPSTNSEDASTLTSEDLTLENEREALKKARDADLPDADGNDGAAGYGNLHFGDQQNGEIKDARSASNGGEFDANALPGEADNNANLAVQGGKGAPDEGPVMETLTSEPGTQANALETTYARQGTDASGISPAQDSTVGAPAPAARTVKAASTQGGTGAQESENNPEASTNEVALANEAPTDITLSNDTVAENDVGATVAVLSATDPDAGDTATYSLLEDNSGLFEIAGNELRLRDGAAFDYEARDSYEVVIQVQDSAGNTYSETVTINVADVNEAPTDIALSGALVNENESGAVIATLSSSDPDANDTAQYMIADDASGLFEITGNALKLKDGAALNYEAQNSYELTLLVEDGAGNVYTETVTINVADLNEGPTELTLSSNDVAENDAGAVVGTLSAFDPDAGDSLTFTVSDDRFEIVGNELKIKNGVSFDYEPADTIDVSVTAADQGGLETTQTFTVNISDINESPTDIGLSKTSVDENDSGAVVATLSASDPDANDTATFSIAEDESDLFEIAGDQLRLREGVSLDHELQDSYELTLMVEDGAGNVYTKVVTINVADLNEGPTDLQLSNASIEENDAGASVGTLTAVDPDDGDSLTYTVSDDRFEVVGNELKAKDGVSFDHETLDSIEVTVTATDESGLSTEQSFSIAVTDLNEAPTDIDLSGASVDENNAGAVVATLSATDQDAGDTATFSIAEDASDLFEVAGNELKLKDGVSLDHEAQESYEITLQVEDSSGATYTETVTISVADLNEGPTDIQLSNTNVAEGDAGAVVGTLTAFDPDEGDTLTFTVSDDRFEVVGDELKLKDGVELDFNDVQSIDVTVTATDSAGAANSQSFSIGVNDVNEGPTLGLATGPGLAASYYNIGHSLSDLDDVDFDATPDATGVVDNLDYMQGQQAFWDGAPNDFFAAKYEGQLVVETGGTYTFSMASDDGSMLFIDGEPVLDNDGLHGTRTRTVTLDLDEGTHEIEVRYFENGGAQTLQLAWSGPDTGGANQVIGGDSYQHGYSADALSVGDDEAGAIVAELTVTDPDTGDTHTFSVSDDRFEVVEDDGAYVLKLKDGVSLDYETESAVDVSVTVTDTAGASDTAQYSIAVEDTNAAPEIGLVGGEGLKASYYDIGHSLSNLDQVDFDATPDAEGVVGSLDYMQGREAFWDGAPGDYFAAKYEGQLMVGEGGTYTFSMASDDGSMLFIDGEPVLDNDGLHGTRTRTVTLDLEPGAHEIEVRYFENGGNQTLQLSWSGPDTGGAQEVIGGDSYRLPGYSDEDQLGLTENASGDVAAVLSIVDAEGDAVTYEVNDDRFELIDNENGVALKLKDGVSVDHEAGAEITVIVTATDEHGESSSQEFSIPVADVNEGPTDISFSGDTVSENDAGAVVATLSAADPDAGDSATFAIADDASGLFEILGNELKLKDGVSLDHEAQDAYDVTVEVTDGAGNAYSETLTVNVANVNEAPIDFILEPVAASGSLSLNQDGGNDDVAVAANMGDFPTDALTVEVTFTSSQTDVGSGVPLFSYAADNGSNNEALIWLESGSGNLHIYLAGQAVNTGISNASLLDGEQHTVSFTWDQASNELKVYVDGEEEFSSSINIRDLRADGTVAFGQEQDAEGGRFDANQVFEGEIAEARIFDYARSAEEIADYAGEPLAGPEAQTGLVSNWVMNSADGGVVQDVAGNNHLQLLNGAEVKGGPAYETPTVVENDAGAVVGTLSASDPETGEAVTNFTLADDASGLFEVVGNELKLKDSASLDHEAQDTYEVTVEAVGASGETTQQTVTINVADINEAPINVSFDPALKNGALSLNEDGGTDDYATAANMEGFPTDALTVEVSIASSQTDVGNGTPLFSYAASNGSDNEALLWLEGSSGNLHVFLAGQKINTGIANSSLLDGEPHQVSFSWDQSSNELKVYVDGEQEFSTSINIRDLRADGTLVFGQEQDAEGGGFNSGQVFEGQISEVRIFDYARSDEEIADNAGRPFDDPETEPGLVNNWVMNAQSGGVIEDRVGIDHLQLRGGASIVDSDFGGAPTVMENEAGAMVGVISATDPQTGEAVTNFVIADDPSGMFELAGNQLKLKDGVATDYESQDSYDVMIEAVGAGGESTMHTVSVSVADIDETESNVEYNIVLGTDGKDNLKGGDGPDEIYGFDGNDKINGHDGDDLLFGGDGKDNIHGGDGNDTIVGGAGDDKLDGGDGSDVFVYEMGDGNDRVNGGAGGWTDSIQLGDGETPLGEFGADWTIELTEGSIVSTDENGINFTEDADGVITLSDGSTINFTDIEEVLI